MGLWVHSNKNRDQLLLPGHHSWASIPVHSSLHLLIHSLSNTGCYPYEVTEQHVCLRTALRATMDSFDKPKTLILCARCCFSFFGIIKDNRWQVEGKWAFLSATVGGSKRIRKKRWETKDSSWLAYSHCYLVQLRQLSIFSLFHSFIYMNTLFRY